MRRLNKTKNTIVYLHKKLNKIIIIKLVDKVIHMSFKLIEGNDPDVLYKHINQNKVPFGYKDYIIILSNRDLDKSTIKEILDDKLPMKAPHKDSKYWKYLDAELDREIKERFKNEKRIFDKIWDE